MRLRAIPSSNQRGRSRKISTTYVSVVGTPLCSPLSVSSRSNACAMVKRTLTCRLTDLADKVSIDGSAASAAPASTKIKDEKRSERTVWLFYHTTPDLPLIFPLTRSSRRREPPSPARLPRLRQPEESARRTSSAARDQPCTP